MRLGALAALLAATSVASLHTEARAMQVTVAAHERTMVYHSPQTPGYTCWAGMWTMPDGAVMVSFTQVTGPFEGWRPRAPKSVLERLPDAQQVNPAYDMTGLAQENVYLRSEDGGRTWQKAASQPFATAMNGFCVGGALALEDGTILRLCWGQALTYSDLRPTGFIQRSRDGARTWEAPEYIHSDDRFQVLPTRIHRLRDGRLLLTGGVAPFDPDSWHWMDLLGRTRHCLWISNDPEGRSWSPPLMVTADDAGFACEEWDSAELDDGSLLAVFRGIVYTPEGRCVSQDRRQATLEKDGDTWRPGRVSMAPFPHDGHPEMLRLREGPVLYLSPTGIRWTADAGATWERLDCPGTAYYPRAVQLPDGDVLAVSHTGSDDPYGKTDQSIVLDRYRFQVR